MLEMRRETGYSPVRVIGSLCVMTAPYGQSFDSATMVVWNKLRYNAQDDQHYYELGLEMDVLQETWRLANARVKERYPGVRKRSEV